MRVAIVGRPGYIHNSYEYSLEHLMGAVGYNTGNLVYMHAITQHINDEKEFFGWKIDHEYVNTNFDVLVFMAANQLDPSLDMTILAELFESLEIPSIVIGLGVQTAKIDAKLEFSSGTLRFIEAIKRNCTMISVRGEYTKKVLNDLGLENVVATGCPSNFINFRHDLGKDIIVKEEIKDVVVNNNILSSEMGSFVNDIILNNTDIKKKFMIQDYEQLLDVCRNKRRSIYYSEVKEILQNNVLRNVNNVDNFLLDECETFVNVEAWMEYLRRFHLSIGTRMHGNMLALQTGIPTVFISHDARLSELISIMKLPNISFDKAVKLKGIPSILNEVDFNANEYDENRKFLAKKFCSLYESVNIDYHFGLKSLAGN